MKNIFIAGCARSGTTLISRLLDGHPDILPFYGETFFFLNRLWIESLPDPEQRFLHFTGRPYDYEKASWPPRKTKIDRESNWEQHKFWADIVARSPDVPTEERLLTETLGANDPRKLFDTLVEIHRRYYWRDEYPPQYVLEKTPRNEFFADEIFSVFPDARMIQIVRDPFDFICSRWRRRSRSAVDRTLEGDVMGWKTSLRRGLIASRGRRERYCFVKFETLVSDPRGLMEKLSRFLEIDFDERLLSPSEYNGERPWKSHSGQAISISVGVVDKRVLEMDARSFLNPEELAFIGSWVRPEYEACGFSKYPEHVDGGRRRFDDPNSAKGTYADQLRRLLRVFRRVYLAPTVPVPFM